MCVVVDIQDYPEDCDYQRYCVVVAGPGYGGL